MCLCLIPEQDRVALETLFDFWKKRPDERTDHISTCFTCTVDITPFCRERKTTVSGLSGIRAEMAPLGLFFHSVQRGHLNSCVLHYLEARRLFHTERP